MAKSLRMVHASGNTFMSLARTKSDVGRLVDLSPAAQWITLTECGELDTIRAISRFLQKIDAPYNVFNPDRGDIAFLVHHDVRLVDGGGPLAIPGKPGPASDGGHGPRHNSWAKLNWKDETIFANGVHFVTFRTDGGNRGDEQVHQAELMASQMHDQARSRNLAIGSGDLNGQLPNRGDLQEIWDAHGMTTTAKETGDMTGTHGHARIDYVWTMDQDHRVSVDDMKVLKSTKFESDHDPIVVDLTIRF